MVLILNCPAAVDAAAIILPSASMAAAKTPLPPPPSATTSIGNDCYRNHQRLPSLLPHSQRSTTTAVFINGDSNGKGRRGQGWTKAQGRGRKGSSEGVCVCVLTWAPAREDLFCNTRGFQAPLHGSPPPSLLITKVKGYLKATQLKPPHFHPPSVSPLPV